MARDTLTTLEDENRGKRMTRSQINEQADREGRGWWLIEANGEVQLQRDDGAAVFESDTDVWEAVWQGVREKDALCKAALQWLVLNSLEEYDRIYTHNRRDP